MFSWTMVHGFDVLYSSGWLLFSLFHNSYKKIMIYVYIFFSMEIVAWRIDVWRGFEAGDICGYCF